MWTKECNFNAISLRDFQHWLLETWCNLPAILHKHLKITVLHRNCNDFFPNGSWFSRDLSLFKQFANAKITLVSRTESCFTWKLYMQLARKWSRTHFCMKLFFFFHLVIISIPEWRIQDFAGKLFNSKSPAQRLGIFILRSIGALINEIFSLFVGLNSTRFLFSINYLNWNIEDFH